MLGGLVGRLSEEALEEAEAGIAYMDYPRIKPFVPGTPCKSIVSATIYPFGAASIRCSFFERRPSGSFCRARLVVLIFAYIGAIEIRVFSSVMIATLAGRVAPLMLTPSFGSMMAV